MKKGDTAVIECTLPHSNQPALPRYRIRGKWLEQSSGTDKTHMPNPSNTRRYNRRFRELFFLCLFSDEYLILPSGNLHISSVSVKHQGMYKCGAYNPLTRETQVEAHGTKLVVRGGWSTLESRTFILLFTLPKKVM